MIYNFEKRRAELLEQCRMEAVIMRAAGMSEADILELFRETMEEYNSDRRFYRTISMYMDPDNETLADTPLSDCGPDVMDEIENPKLHTAMMKLKEDERRIIILHIIDGLPLTLIAALQGKPYDVIRKQYHRAIQKIKKYF